MQVEEMYLPEPGNYELLKILVLYLDNPSKGAISESI